MLRLSSSRYLLFFLLVVLMGANFNSPAQQADAGIKQVKPIDMPKAKSVTIKGNIKKMLVTSPNALDVYTFQYQDVVTGRRVIIPINKDSAGNFTATIPLTAKQQISLNQTYQFGNEVQESSFIDFFFYAAPGEDMQLDYYLPEGFTGRRIEFKGNLGPINNQDRIYQDKLDSSEFSPLIDFKRLDSLNAGNYAEYKQYISERLKGGLAYNNAYFKSVNNHPFLKEQADIDMRYNAAGMLLAGLRRAKMNDSLLLDFFKENNILLNDPKAYGHDRYAIARAGYYKVLERKFFTEYKEPKITLAGIAEYVANEYPDLSKQYKALAKKFQDTTVKKSEEEGKTLSILLQPYIDEYYYSLYNKQLFDYLSELKDPDLRDQYLTMQLKELLLNDEVRQVKPLIAAYKIKVRQGVGKEDFLKKYKEEYEKVYNSKLSVYSVLNPSSNIKADSVWTEVLNKHKGKVIYVDVWATWCDPCLAEMGNSKALREKLAGKDVVFLYLCISSQKESLWKSLIAQNEMEGQHYFLDKLQSQQLVKTLDIKGIPRYLLIDKSGNIVEANAARPGNVQALESITALIQ